MARWDVAFKAKRGYSGGGGQNPNDIAIFTNSTSRDREPSSRRDRTRSYRPNKHAVGDIYRRREVHRMVAKKALRLWELLGFRVYDSPIGADIFPIVDSIDTSKRGRRWAGESSALGRNAVRRKSETASVAPVAMSTARN